MSSTHVLVVYTSPVTPAQDAEYNRWYNEEHLRDVLNVSGFVSARRFKLPDKEDGTPYYLALYEMETKDSEAVLVDLMSKAGTPAMEISPAIDMQNLSMTVATAITGVVTV